MASRSQSRTTTDHDEIHRWTEARGGRPAVVKNTRGKGDGCKRRPGERAQAFGRRQNLGAKVDRPQSGEAQLAKPVKIHHRGWIRHRVGPEGCTKDSAAAGTSFWHASH